MRFYVWPSLGLAWCAAVKALVAYGAGRLVLTDRDEPKPGASEVVVAVAFANICHTDHYIINGTHPTARYPVVPGHEVSGVIVGVGHDIEPSRIGERVVIRTQIGCGICAACASGYVGRCIKQLEVGSTLDGGWQERLAVPATAALLVPESLSLDEASLIEPSANAYAAATRAEIRRSDLVVIVGPGPIGLLTLLHAQLDGAREVVLVGLESDAKRLEYGATTGASNTLSIRSGEPGARQVLEAIGEPGADVVVQCAGSIEATNLAIQIAATGARVILEGYAGNPERVSFSPDEVVVRETTIRGVRGWTFADFAATLEIHAKGVLDAKALITDRFPLEQYEVALQRSVDYAAGVIKVAFLGGAT